jgi:beta-mannanase
MSRRDFLRAGGLGLAGAILSASLPSIVAPESVRAALAAPNSSRIALGAFAAGVPWGFENIDEFSRLAGQKPAIIHWFEHWLMNFESERMDAAVSREGVPLVSWEPWDWEKPVEQPDYTLKTIVEGKHDAYIRQWARSAAAWGKPFYLRFAPEMNGDWRPWSAGVNGNTSAEFVSAWRKVYSIFRREGATNARWVWSPISQYEGSTPFKELYPGDAYVDWVGLDGYNWGTTQSWSRWQRFTEIFSKSYVTLTRMTRKPMMIPEMASAELGGDKAAWVKNTFLREIPTKYPRIKAVVWFHADKETDWRINSSPDMLRAYQEVVANARFQQRLV